MSPQTQSKLLRVIEDGEVRRLGGRGSIRVDVRLLAATNRPLEKMIEKREFRADLFHLLNTVTIALPPLRERREDIPELASFFLARSAAKLGFSAATLTPEALRLLTAFDWPGNVRQLKNIVRRALILSSGYPIGIEHVAASLREGTEVEIQTPPTFNSDSEKALNHLVTEALRLAEKGAIPAALPFLVGKIESALFTAALAHTHNNRTRAARLIGVTTPTLRGKLLEHRICDVPEES